MARNNRRANGVIAQALWLGICAFILSLLLNTFFESASRGVPLVLGVPLFFLVVALGVLSDGLGVASTRAKEGAMNAMASRKVSGAREGLWFVRNASKVSSVFNDLMGDVSATISGALAVSITIRLTEHLPGFGPVSVTSLGVGLASLLTVGGKALFKNYSLRHSEAIVLQLGKLLSLGMRLGRRRGRNR